jgi:hypothetical protein
MAIVLVNMIFTFPGVRMDVFVRRLLPFEYRLRKQACVAGAHDKHPDPDHGYQDA